jgi:hypothetical protein
MSGTHTLAIYPISTPFCCLLNQQQLTNDRSTIIGYKAINPLHGFYHVASLFVCPFSIMVVVAHGHMIAIVPYRPTLADRHNVVRHPIGHVALEVAAVR